MNCAHKKLKGFWPEGAGDVIYSSAALSEWKQDFFLMSIIMYDQLSPRERNR